MRPLQIPVETPGEEARARAEELLRGDAPAWLRPLGALRDLAEEQLLRLLEELGRLLDVFFWQALDGSGGGGQPSWPLLVLVLVVVLGLGVLVWRVGLPRLDRTREVRVETDAEVSAGRYRDLAEEAATRGDWAEALLEEFRALVRELEVMTVVDPRPSRTALEVAYRASLSVPAAEPSLRSAAEHFNASCYGPRRAVEADWHRLRDQAREVVEQCRHADLATVAGGS